MEWGEDFDLLYRTNADDFDMHPQALSLTVQSVSRFSNKPMHTLLSVAFLCRGATNGKS